MAKKALIALVAGGLTAASGAVICAGLGNFLAFASAIHFGAGAAHSGKGPSDQEVRTFVLAVTFVGAVFGLVLGGCGGALLGLLLARLGRSDKDRLPARAPDRPGPRQHAVRMWLLGGAVAVVLLLPTALSLAWLLYLYGSPPKAPPAPAGPGPTVPGPPQPQGTASDEEPTRRCVAPPWRYSDLAAARRVTSRAAPSSPPTPTS
jgi:hypothetical protein